MNTNVLGGVSSVVESVVTPVKAIKTAGKAAKASGTVRDYTPRGTTYWARRVILINDNPVGRGRPTKIGKGERKVVYVPVGMDYDVAAHGLGVKYNSNSHKATHRRIVKSSVSYTFDNGIAPAKAKIVKAKIVKAKTVKAKTVKAKVVKAKAKTVKAKTATIPVASVDAANQPAEIPTENSVVTAQG